MILLVHLLFGAAIGSAVKNVPLAIILAFLSHYFLDLSPHIEYDIEIRNKKHLREKIINILKIALDFFLGILLIFLFSKNNPLIYVCAFFAILPDGFAVLNNHIQNRILRAHKELKEKIHFLKNKKIPPGRADIFWRIASQAAAVIVSIAILRF